MSYRSFVCGLFSFLSFSFFFFRPDFCTRYPAITYQLAQLSTFTQSFSNNATVPSESALYYLPENCPETSVIPMPEKQSRPYKHADTVYGDDTEALLRSREYCFFFNTRVTQLGHSPVWQLAPPPT